MNMPRWERLDPRSPAAPVLRSTGAASLISQAVKRNRFLTVSDFGALESALAAQSSHLPCESPEFLECEVKLMMSALWTLNPRRADSYHDWRSVCASLKSASRHDLRANVSEFKRWSKQSYKYDEQACLNLWAALDGTSPDVIIRMAREDGWRPDSEKPEIVITPNESRVISDSIAAVAKCKDVFQRGGCLMRVCTPAPAPTGIARESEPPRIELLPLPALRERLASSANFVRETKDGKKSCHVPQWVVAGVESQSSYFNRPIEAISEVPTLRRDGSVICDPGFDAETGTFYAPSAEFPIVRNPKEAIEALLALLVDFPFAGENHKAAFVAMLLTPLARLAFYGPSPLHLIDSNTPGSGKLLLVNLVSLIACGRLMPVSTAPESDAEWRKQITSKAIAGDLIYLIDNIAGKLASPSLDAALTATTWSDRILGISKTVTLPLRLTFFGTGNNVTLHRDTLRRTNYCRLQSRVENPETRSGFKYPSLLNHVREKRGYYTACALAILQGYYKAGRPDQKLPPLGSFEGWSDLVRSAVVWCGLPDPMGTRVALAESDDDTTLLRQLLAGWREADPGGRGLTAAEAVAKGAEHPTLYAAIQELGGNNPKHSLGLKLRTYKGRVCNGECFEKCERGKTSVWRVIQCKN